MGEDPVFGAFDCRWKQSLCLTWVSWPRLRRLRLVRCRRVSRILCSIGNSYFCSNQTNWNDVLCSSLFCLILAFCFRCSIKLIRTSSLTDLQCKAQKTLATYFPLIEEDLPRKGHGWRWCKSAEHVKCKSFANAEWYMYNMLLCSTLI